ncbi:hypothetical protein CKO28_00345 [Rhodovibrio sodomensis]|uniref:Bacteriophage T5 Orf172 DNA-binding domain-containing protein n=1 Tax=Rhodovibrio sodomensis TaxID=1088 RepID=A0ABS1D7U1_9PROT|nr:GIY-YIG nuclease family protein [Rhodovibrio sodomensis]MBK1666489.1 hypothetical protein [Rhodovibrio sodomensis]
MALETPVFRVLMGSGNACFGHALANRVVFKHRPPDAYQRYLDGEDEALRDEITRILTGLHGGQSPDRKTVTTYRNAVIRFHETMGGRVVTYSEGDLWWAELDPDGMSWLFEEKDEGSRGAQPAITHLMAYPLRRAWTRFALDGVNINTRMLASAHRSLSTLRTEFSMANPKVARYFNAVVEGEDLGPWHLDDRWAARERRLARQGSERDRGRDIAGKLMRFLDEADVSYTVVRDGKHDGQLYAAYADGLPGWIKIGYTTGSDPNQRLSDLQTGNPFPLRLLGTRDAPIAPFAETIALEQLPGEKRAAGGSEWFWIDPKTAQNAMDRGAEAAQAARRRLLETAA